MRVCVCVRALRCGSSCGDGLAMIFEEGDFLVTNGVSMLVKSCLPVKRGGNGTSLLIESLERNGEALLFPSRCWFVCCNGTSVLNGPLAPPLLVSFLHACQMSFLIPGLLGRT